METLDKRRKYPGRTRVMSRESARDYLFNERVADLGSDKFACSSPIELPAVGLPSGIIPDNPQVLTLTVHARCRQCDNCLAHRRRLWMARALDELAAASRTWFGTLTVAPAERVRLKYLAERRRLRAGNESVSSLDHSEQYRLFADALGQEVTKWLKRIRGVASGPLRYLLVFEAHKDGFPHVHLLLHEQGEPISKRTLEEQWRIGFSHWRLVNSGDPRSAWYVCKYLAKDALTRVRASGRYGQGRLICQLTEQTNKVCDAVRDATERNGDAAFSQGSETTEQNKPRNE